MAADDLIHASTSLTATELGRLTEVDLDTNVVADADSGSPRAISGHQEGDVGAGPLGNPADIASIDLPSGNWLVLAKAVETNRGSVSHHVFCDVTKSRDETTVWLRKSGLAVRYKQMLWMSTADMEAAYPPE